MSERESLELTLPSHWVVWLEYGYSDYFDGSDEWEEETAYFDSVMLKLKAEGWTYFYTKEGSKCFSYHPDYSYKGRGGKCVTTVFTKVI